MTQVQIMWEPSKKQMDAYKILQDKKHTEILFGGAAGGGKSHLGCAWIILNCMNYPGTRWLIGRAVLKTLKQTTLLTFFDICKAWGLKPGRDYRYNSMEGTITFVQESSVYLKDLFLYPSDPEFDSLGSTEFTGGFIDEASQITVKAKNIVSSRFRYKLDEYDLIPKLLIATNPSKNFLYKDFYKPWKENRLEPYRAFIPSFVEDNPYISKHYKDNLDKLDPISKQRLRFGNWEYDGDEAKLFEYDALIDMFTNTVDESDDKYLTCDVARKGQDTTVIIYWEGMHAKQIWQYKKLKTTEVSKLLEEKSQKYQVRRSHIAIDEDGVGGGVVDQLSGSRGFVNNSSPIKRNSKDNYANLKSQCYFYLAELVRKGEVAITTQNETFKEKIIEELEQVKQKDPDKDGKLAVEGKEKIKENIGRSPDFADALMMRMLFVVAAREVRLLSDPNNVTGLF